MADHHAETVMVRGERAPRGAEGERLLVNGERMAMRLWENEKAGVGKPDHRNPYEYVAYVVKGALKITIDGHAFEVRAGDSYCVPANTTYSLQILEQATVVEATSPSDRGAVTQTSSE
ncbi:MAG: cupin domain-containing protein [Pyrinomonadaceae bacterium]|nr:cupin domain-containing protein [Pyrinomonadaceae bacterium]